MDPARVCNPGRAADDADAADWASFDGWMVREASRFMIYFTTGVKSLRLEESSTQRSRRDAERTEGKEDLDRTFQI